MRDTEKHGSGQTVVYAPGVRREVAAFVDAVDAKRVLVLSTAQQSDLGMECVEALGTRAVGLFAKTVMHTPVEVTQEALAHLHSVAADCVVSVGGGSTIGLGKALALRHPLHHIAVPTTYAGSECTPILGQTENGQKTTLSDPKLRPVSVLYDPELVATLPREMTVTSALNAMAHAVEALYARDRTALSDAMAMEGLTAFHTALPHVVHTPDDLQAREDTQRGTWACGTVLGQVGMALHHKLCHTLGGSFGLPHAQTHAIILPHATAFNAKAAATALAPVARLFGGSDPGQALWDFAARLDVPLALRDLGLQKSDLERVVTLATQNPYWNPRPVTADGVRALLERAWAGAPPNA